MANKSLVCERCGGNLFVEKDGYRICRYCKSKFALPAQNTAKGSNISVRSDVQALLQKCRTDRKNARRYANLILDIDPGNEEAKKYL